MASMKTRLSVSIFFTIVMFIASIGTALAQERLPGVSTGHEFTYSQRSLWIADDTTVPMFNGLADINMTDYYKVTVTKVSGSNVSMQTKWQFKNGTSVETNGSVDTETTNYQGGFWSIIGKDLNANDRVHPNFEKDKSTINETLLWSYQGYQREANHLVLDFYYEENNTSNSTYMEHVDSYFDKQTGALIQLEDTHTYHNPDITLIVTWQLISTNAWDNSDGDQFLTITIVAIGATILVAAAILIVGKRYKK